ncbi:HAD-IIIC family phosphatase [Candidatus Nitrosotenuis chungbukensis]|uniref:HAD-IIIC family phosphatase n=1 Tax=Candidatus Nitrosotenuis chungbukensis TaxID=1353246 RepID=UPI0005B29BB0|nr:HAD-IIIC family phosphatase [Candidatus Nitrosotenuis chungbukensis]
MTIEQKLSYYINKASELTGRTFGKKIRIGILCSFTINGLEEAMRVKSAEKNIDCITYVGGYNQYNQEILNHESNVYKFSPDLTFLIVDTRNILGNLFHFPYSISASERRSFVEKKVKEIQNLANAFTSKTKSKLVIANFPLPTYSPHGIFETKTEYGLHKMIEDLNSRLIDSFANSDSIYIYDFNGFVSQYGEDNIFDYKQFLFGDMKISLDYIPYLANDLIGYVVGHLGLSKKCIILDLDNTLWGGIVGEDGFNGIRLGPEPPGNSYLEFQRVLLSLYQRGIILAINSKNNYDEALKVIKEHPYMVLREEHFASIRINWNDKVSNMKEIANELNIGADSMVFFDDDPVNREYMRINMPQILTVDLPQDPSQYAQTIKKMNEFSVLSITDEDAQRGKMYLEQRKRSDLEQSAPDLESFLKNLDLKVLIKNANEFTIPRISQLTLKTNQFNLTTKRYQESDIKKLSEDDRYVVGCAQVTDKFGDNGITGVFIVRKENPKEWFIDTFLLSCRVMGREVEKGILGYIINKAKENEIERIKAQFIPSQKNKPIEEFLPNCGFQKDGDYWIYQSKTQFTIPDFLMVSVE